MPLPALRNAGGTKGQSTVTEGPDRPLEYGSVWAANGQPQTGNGDGAA